MIDFGLQELVSNPLVQAAVIGSILVPIGMSFKSRATATISWLGDKFTINVSVNKEDNHQAFCGVSKLLLDSQIWRTSTRINEVRDSSAPEYAAEGTGFSLYKGHLMVFTASPEKRGLYDYPSVKITCWGRPSKCNKLLEELIREGYELYRRPPDGKIRIMKYGSSGNGDYPSLSNSGGSDYVDARPLSTVAIPEGVEDKIRASFDNFFSHRKLYTKLGITYKMNILLYGPPGTGKSSLVKAMASEYNLDLRIASSNVTASTLESLPSSIKPYIFLLEDVDVHKFSVDRSDASIGKVNMSSLLNLLDGVSTPEGMIAVLTTNSLDSLDPAIYRPGRIDLLLHIDKLDRVTVDSWAKRNDLAIDLDSFQYPVSGAEVSAETFKRNIKLN